MCRNKVNKSLYVIVILLLIAGMLSLPVNAGAASRIEMNPGQTKVMKLPKGWKSASWSSNKKAVAKVSSKGVVKAMAPGTAVITAKSGKKTKKYTVRVKEVEQEVDNAAYKIKITAGNQTFSAVLYHNETVSALIKKLPMTVTMAELNGNEKYYYLSESLPVDSGKPGNIHTGDIMLYGRDCLVLFYDDFSTSYSYTPIGKISNPDGLAEALGSGDVRVSFVLE